MYNVSGTIMALIKHLGVLFLIITGIFDELPPAFSLFCLDYLVLKTGLISVIQESYIFVIFSAMVCNRQTWAEQFPLGCNLLQISPVKVCFEKLRFFLNLFSECRKCYLRDPNPQSPLATV